jgi:shikimate kinase
MNLVLMGYMGSGKSAVGQCLGAHLHRDFIDLDHRIEEMEGLTISEIFEKKGAVYFRKRESEILRQTLNDSKYSVIALGGGTPIYGDNLKWINDLKLNFSVYLKIDVKPLVSRLWHERKHRPIIADVSSPEDLEEFVRKHLFERAFIYQQAHLVYEVADLDVPSIAKGIIEASKVALG